MPLVLLWPYFFHPWFVCWTPKNPKILFSLHGAMRTARLMWRNPFGHWSNQSASFNQNDQNAPVKLVLTKSQTRSKSSQNNIFHGFTSNPSFSEIFSKFDLDLTLCGPKNPNFNLGVRTGWTQHHCEDYQIPIPVTTHELKLELERPRYHETGSQDQCIDQCVNSVFMISRPF